MSNKIQKQLILEKAINLLLKIWVPLYLTKNINVHLRFLRSTKIYKNSRKILIFFFWTLVLLFYKIFSIVISHLAWLSNDTKFISFFESYDVWKISAMNKESYF